MAEEFLSQPPLSKGVKAHLWKDIRLLSEAAKAPDHTYIEREEYQGYTVIHAILPVGMNLPVHHSFESMLFSALIVAVYTGVVIRAWDKIKRKEDIPKVFGCRKCEIWFDDAQGYIQHWKEKHERNPEPKKES